MRCGSPAAEIEDPEQLEKIVKNRAKRDRKILLFSKVPNVQFSQPGHKTSSPNTVIEYGWYGYRIRLALLHRIRLALFLEMELRIFPSLSLPFSATVSFATAILLDN